MIGAKEAKMGRTEKILLQWLIDQGGYTYMSTPAIARETGLNRRTLELFVQALQHKGVLSARGSTRCLRLL